MEATFTKHSGEIVTREYVKRRASAYLSRFRRYYTLDERRTALSETVDNDDWMRVRNGYTVGAICCAVWDHI